MSERGRARKREKEKCRGKYLMVVGGVCRVSGVVTGAGSCLSADSPVPLPLVPPYHLCLSHLKGCLVPFLFSPFVLLTNVAALQGDDTKTGTEGEDIS